MNARLLMTKVVRSLKRDGVRATFQKFLSNVAHGPVSDDFDTRYGTETGGVEPLWKFQISSPNAHFGAGYQATREQELLDALDFLREDLRSFTFIDLGCGKGRTLLVAAQRGFELILGVEFVPELANIAKANIAKRRIANAAIVQADAATYLFPDSDMIVYLYNPFSQEVLRKVIANLLLRRGRRLFIIYKVPQCAVLFDQSGFTRFGSPPASRTITVWTMPA